MEVKSNRCGVQKLLTREAPLAPQFPRQRRTPRSNTQTHACTVLYLIADRHRHIGLETVQNRTEHGTAQYSRLGARESLLTRLDLFLPDNLPYSECVRMFIAVLLVAKTPAPQRSGLIGSTHVPYTRKLQESSTP